MRTERGGDGAKEGLYFDSRASRLNKTCINIFLPSSPDPSLPCFCNPRMWARLVGDLAVLSLFCRNASLHLPFNITRWFYSRWKISRVRGTEEGWALFSKLYDAVSGSPLFFFFFLIKRGLPTWHRLGTRFQGKGLEVGIHTSFYCFMRIFAFRRPGNGAQFKAGRRK